jgi:hypothetical protein
VREGIDPAVSTNTMRKLKDLEATFLVKDVDIEKCKLSCRKSPWCSSFIYFTDTYRQPFWRTMCFQRQTGKIGGLGHELGIIEGSMINCVDGKIKFDKHVWRGSR